MKRNIILIRHAKSDWQKGETQDHQRPLNIRGKRDLPIMTSVLISHYPSVDLALASDSERTVDTIQGLHKYGYALPVIQFTPKLYLASVEKFENELASLSDDITTVLLCAHNPGVSEYIQKLCGIEFIDIPTLGIAMIEVDLNDWTDIYTAKGTLIRFDYPKKKEKED